MVRGEFSDVSGSISVLCIQEADLRKGPYSLSVYENWVVEMSLVGHLIELTLWEAAVQEGYDHLRPLWYADAAVVVMSFAIDDFDSFRNVADRWHAELLHFCSSPTPPILLVGCKSDLRWQKGRMVDSFSQRAELVTKEQGQALASRIGAVGYLECSSKTGEGTEEVMELISRTVLSWNPLIKRKERRACLIM